MQRRSVQLLASLVAIAVLLCWALWLLSPVDRVNRESFARISLGMTEAEVEEVLGRPNANGAADAIIMFEGVPESFADPVAFPAERLRQWASREHAILVEFDERGQVTGRYFGHVNPPEGLLRKLRRRFGL